MTEKQIEQRRDAGKKGGRAVVEKYGSAWMSELGRRGAKKFHSLYVVQPIGTNSWAIVGRKDNQIIGVM